MAPDTLLEELRAVLKAEREAIRRLDTATIMTASEKKEALLAVVVGASDADKPALCMVLAQVRDDLKRNLVLLAHAREFVREAIQRGRPQALPPGARISVSL
ncbi:MAG: hypothetical protein JWP97_1955 [Labilithrix sp.]|nr:hypothetical protein [Labilithrix sp.]